MQNSKLGGGFKGGSGNKKMKKYPRIIDFLEAHHKDIYELFEDLAMHGALTPRRGGSITFLLPEKKYVTKIQKSIESDKPEEATDMLSSLILLDLFEDASDFQERRDDIPNVLGKKLTVKDIKNGKVMIDNGELTINKNFKPFERQGNAKRGNIAVWDLVGEVNFADAPKSAFKYAKEIPRKPKPAGVTGGNEAHNLLHSILKEEHRCIETGHKIKDESGVEKYQSPIIDAVARILYSFQNNQAYAFENQVAQYCLTRHPVIDFCLLFRAPELFNINKVLSAYQEGISNQPVTTIRSFFNLPANDAIKDLKSTILQTGQSHNLLRVIENTYDTLCKNNTVEGVPVYSEQVFQLIQKICSKYTCDSGNYLLHLDAAKCYIFNAIEALGGATQLTSIADVDRKNRANEFGQLFSLFDKGIKNTIVELGSHLLAKTITAPHPQIVSDFWSKFGLYFPFNVTLPRADSYTEDRLIFGGSDDDSCHFDDCMDGFDDSEFKLSNRSVAELRAFVKINGKLPDI